MSGKRTNYKVNQEDYIKMLAYIKSLEEAKEKEKEDNDKY